MTPNPPVHKETLLKALAEVEQIAQASKLARLMQQPYRYLLSIAYWKLIYPRTRRSLLKSAQTFFGDTMQVALPASSDIYITGGKSDSSEIRLAKFMIHTLNPGQQVLDIGAHYGYFSLLAAKLVGPTGQVHTFEASKATLAILEQNTAAHKTIHVHHKAVSDSVGVLRFNEFPTLYSEYNTLDVSQFENERWYKNYPPQQIEVPAIRLDDFVASEQLSVDFIKIDVEGAEHKVISGAQAMLQSRDIVLVMEFLSAKRHNEGHVHALALLQSLGYQAFSINASGHLEQCPDPNTYLSGQGIDSDNIVFKKG